MTCANREVSTSAVPDAQHVRPHLLPVAQIAKPKQRPATAPQFSTLVCKSSDAKLHLSRLQSDESTGSKFRNGRNVQGQHPVTTQHAMQRHACLEVIKEIPDVVFQA